MRVVRPFLTEQYVHLSFTMVDIAEQLTMRADYCENGEAAWCKTASPAEEVIRHSAVVFNV